jgi:hypothetical protein
VAMGATQDSREEFGMVGRRRELAEGCPQRGGGNGVSADGGCAREETGTATYSWARTGREIASRLRPPIVQCGVRRCPSAFVHGRGEDGVAARTRRMARGSTS